MLQVQTEKTLKPVTRTANYEGVQKTEAGLVSGADGLAVDNDGRVNAATSIGVQVFSPKGQHHLAFSGPDKKTLYVVGRNAAWKVQMLAAGYKGRAK